MINSISKEQESKIPEYIVKWISLASQPIDRDKARKLAGEIWAKEKPLVFFGESLENTMGLIAVALKSAGAEKIKKGNSQLSFQLHSQLDSQLDSQLYLQLESQLRSQLYLQLDFQLRSQLYLQLDFQLYSQLSSQLESQLHSQLKNSDYNFYTSYYLYEWAGIYNYGKYIGVEFNGKLLKKFFDILLNLPICVFVGNAVFVVEKPQCLWVNGELSSQTKPAIGWKDGTGFYFLDGIRFEKDLWQKIVGKTLPAKEAFKLENSEQRLVALKYLGAAKMIAELGGETFAKDQYGELIRLNKMKDTVGDPYVFYKALDPSEGEDVYIRVAPDVKTPQEAMTKAYRLELFNLNYKPEKRT